MANHTNPQIALICAQEAHNGYQQSAQTTTYEIVQRAEHFLAFLEGADAAIQGGDDD